MRIILFEDEGYKNLFPLTYTRPIFALRCGARTMYEKIQDIYKNTKISVLVREYLVEKTRVSFPNCDVNELPAKDEETVLVLNGRTILNKTVLGEEGVLISNGEIIGLKTKFRNIKNIIKKYNGIVYTHDLKNIANKLNNELTLDAEILNYPWEFVLKNEEEIERDFKLIRVSSKGSIDKRSIIYGKRAQVYLGDGARVEGGVVLDARDGPIWIGKKSVVRFPSILEGPCFIGSETRIDGARIRKGTSIGNCCRIGGEIEKSIILDYSNKHHDGFLGHSYIGEWVNLGAMTTNSDLKNNYGEISVYISGSLINSHEIKVGCFIGDHTKTAIGTLINTGTVIGVACNIFGGSVRKFLPSFSWGNSENFIEHSLKAAIEAARIMMERREVQQTEVERKILENVFELTKEERGKCLKDKQT